MRVLIAKKRPVKSAARAPFIVEYLCEECRQHFDEVKENLELMGVDYEINPRIVRGLDYYEKRLLNLYLKISVRKALCAAADMTDSAS